MPVIKPESHQKKKPTRHAKRKRIVIDDDHHSPADRRMNNDPISAETENSTDDHITMVSPERGTSTIPVRLFDDAVISPPILSVAPVVNNRYTKFKKSVVKKSSPILDNHCVLTLLRSSFVQQSIGELKTGNRKLVHFGHARRAAMNNFFASTNTRKKTDNPYSNRRSVRNLPASNPQKNVIDLDISGVMNHAFDLSSCNIRRYIIEDIMFLSVGELVTLLIDVESNDTTRWESITNIQKFDYDKVMVGGRSYYQVPSRVRSNNRKDEFVSGHHDNNTINYLVLNKGGAGLTVDFVVKGDDKDNSIGGIELKFSSFF